MSEMFPNATGYSSSPMSTSPMHLTVGEMLFQFSSAPFFPFRHTIAYCFNQPVIFLVSFFCTQDSNFFVRTGVKIDVVQVFAATLQSRKTFLKILYIKQGFDQVV